MKFVAILVISFGCYVGLLVAGLPKRNGASVQSERPLDDKLEKRIGDFDTSGRTLIANVLELAYGYQVPMGIEYVDRDAVSRPMTMKFHDDSLGGIFKGIVGQFPEYRVDFSGGVVHVYSPKAREDSSNLLNTMIKDFAITKLDTHQADLELVCAMARETGPPGPCGGSIAAGQWGPLKITLHMQNARVYEILDAVVAKNGKAIWTVMVPPEKLSKFQTGGLWHIYPLETDFQTAVTGKLSRLTR